MEAIMFKYSNSACRHTFTCTYILRIACRGDFCMRWVNKWLCSLRLQELGYCWDDRAVSHKWIFAYEWGTTL